MISYKIIINIKHCQVRCNYLMPNTTVENNFQLGASSDLYKTYQNKLAASPYTFKSLFMIHKENYFNYCNSVIHTGRHGSSTICLDLSCWCSEYQHENHQPKGSQTQIIIWNIFEMSNLIILSRRFTNTNNDLKIFEMSNYCQGRRCSHSQGGRPACT